MIELSHTRLRLLGIGLISLICSAITLFPTPSNATETDHWRSSNEANKSLIDHHSWQNILDTYLIGNDASGINLFRYASVTRHDKKKLNHYLNTLQGVDPRTLRLDQQKAYWVNIYNALTVQLILDNYPVKSITKLGNKFFSFGPWDDDAALIAGEALSLNDIEHKILRPIFKDPRIHYAVNCASYGCPNLSKFAYTAENTEQLLNQGACDYINHSRGVTFNDGELLLSSIYDWYIEDFGGTLNSVIEHLLSCAQPNLKLKLEDFKRNPADVDHHYDWQLNEIK